MTVLKAVRLFDGADLQIPGVCVIRGNRILSTSLGDVPHDAIVIELGNATLMPGLIDCHTHVTALVKKSAFETIPLPQGSAANSLPEAMLLSLNNALALLANGFTTIRDVGTFAPGVDIALRDAINNGLVLGPRMFVASQMLTITGGHFDYNELAPWLSPDPEYKRAIGSGPYSFKELVREHVKRHADLIKITATGGVLSYGDTWDAPHMNLEEIQAVTEEAQSLA